MAQLPQSCVARILRDPGASRGSPEPEDRKTASGFPFRPRGSTLSFWVGVRSSVPLTLLALLVACAAVLLPALPARAVPLRVTKVVLSGDPVPGLPGETFGGSPGALVNDAGQLAVTARVGSGPTVTGLWSWDVAEGGPLKPVALPGPAAGAPPGVMLAGAFARSLTTSGKIGYQASYVVGPGGVTATSNVALVLFDPATGHSLRARSGDPAPGNPGQVFVLNASADAIPHFNDAGVLAFSAGSFSNPPLVFGGGFWTSDGTGPPTPVVIAGSPAPGDSGLGIGTPVISDLNDAGQVAFAAGLIYPTPGPSQPGLFGPDGAGGLYEVARVGGQAPGAPEGARFQSFPGGGFFSFNEAGAMAFAARLATGAGGVTGDNQWGLWRSEGPAETTLLFRAGEAAPGAPPGAVFGSFYDIALNDTGQYAFSGHLASGPGGVTSATDSAIWGPDGAGGTRLVAREGDPIGILPGESWGGLLGVQIANDGAVFFDTNLGGRTTLLYARPESDPRIVVREGDDVDLGGGDVRTLQTLIDWRQSDDLRRYAVSARFADGSSGLFLVTIPEPGTAALVGLGIALLARRERRPR